jgi:hypothetical protein
MGVLALPRKAVLLLRAALVGIAAAGVLIVGDRIQPVARFSVSPLIPT